MTEEQFSQLIFFMTVAGGISGGAAVGIGVIVFGIVTLVDKSEKSNTVAGVCAITFGLAAIAIAVYSFLTFRSMILRGVL